MAGSEQEGVEGADGELFAGATWVLTPTADTDPQAFLTVCSVVSSLGAEVIALPPDRRDTLVDVVVIAPHLSAPTLMWPAASVPAAHTTLLPVAAGRFRE